MTVQLLADDPADRTLAARVHPEDWESPVPADRYNLVVVGGGPAGLIAALGAAGLGAKVALVEKHLLGGDCLNGGCVPSKALLRAALHAREARNGRALGNEAQVHTDFGRAMQRMRSIRAAIGEHDSAERLAREGIDVFLGHARFTGPDTIEVGEHTLKFVRACIATGAGPAVPPIPGLRVAEPLTNETLFTLTEAPDQPLVLGAGVIGCEMAQAFAAFGTQVTVIDRAERVLSREDPEASEAVRAALEQDGVRLHLGAGIESVERDGEQRTVVLSDGTRLTAPALLVALGRRSNLDLDLETAGVTVGDGSIAVDAYLRTSNPRIYAAGDVIGGARFTHAADHQARIVVQNALFFGRRRHAGLILPRVTYTHPEVAAVGIGAAEAAADPALTAFTEPLSGTDRGATDGVEGFLRIWADGKGRIHGATIVGPGAGELLAPVTLAMTQGIRLSAVASTVHPYPTLSEAFFRAASAYNRTRLAPWMKRLTTLLLSWRR